MAALPYFDEIDPSTIDVLLITHFHLDHAASLPYFLEKTTFKGRVFMTYAQRLSTNINASMDKIEVIDFHQTVEVEGIRFWCYTAGHVLGAAMLWLILPVLGSSTPEIIPVKKTDTSVLLRPTVLPRYMHYRVHLWCPAPSTSKHPREAVH
ncbi:hypothetical protein M0R45_026240 [Rubus argutus]|uniref:Metallo-beta-lactamase domain-containing protein n=1 Tax=Rubus argutus TaxID=59490 RepID=A0AAW1X0C7_RUBAR